jgi:hypothetical protein
VAEGHAELDSFDIVEGLLCEGESRWECSTWPLPAVTAQAVIDPLLEQWRT